MEYAEIDGCSYGLKDPESGKLVFAAAEGHINDGGELATQVVDELLHHGAGEILRRVKAID